MSKSNSYLMKFFALLFIIQVCFYFDAMSQPRPTASISGKVFDKSSNGPLEYATVTVVNRQTGKTVTGTVTDAKGSFLISNIPYDTYKINVEFIGYEKVSMDNYVINGSKRIFTLGTVFLNSATHSLGGVTVLGDKPIVENKIDKIVYNTSNDITSQGGAAVDVLKKVPQVTVDIDGNVELQGNSNIRFLINGKPSSVFGNSVSDALASIPASQIKSIEAITNPGAKYDSQGTGGIINIILYDNKMQGVNGNINLSAGSRIENASVNLNMRHNNFGINAFFGGNAQLKSNMPNYSSRFATDTTAKTITNLIQTSNTDFNRNGFRSGMGFDWDITKNDALTGSLGFNSFGSKNNGVVNQESLVQDYSSNPIADIYTLGNTDSKFRFKSIDYSVDYKKKFNKEGQELDILYNASNGTPYSRYSQYQTILGNQFPYSGSASSNPGKDNQTNISVDYTHPVNDKITFETGAKMVYEHITSNADVTVLDASTNEYITDAFQSYDLDYKMRVYAGYLSGTFRMFNFLNLKVGGRYEHTNVSIDYPNAVIPDYGNVVPSIVLSHDFSKTKSIKLAYSKRIQRPGYRDLNPFVNLSDPYNITTGNLLLKPEVGHNLELGYSNTFKKGGNINISLIERISTHDIKSITTYYPTYLIGDSTYVGVSVTKGMNTGSEYNSGISISGSYPVTSKLNLRGNLMVSHRYLVTNQPTGNFSTGIRTRLNLNATYQLPKDLVIEAFGFYNSASKNIQGKTPQFFIYNFAFRKLFWDKKASFGFTTTNPFSKYVKQVTTISAESYTSRNVRQMPIRSFGVSFTYKFGKLEFSKNKERGGEDDNSNFLNNGSAN